jgi:hypothetical protein
MLRTRCLSRAYACLLSALLGFAGTAPASAQAILKVTTKGTIDASCSISVQSNFPAADFASSGNVNGAALVNCNQGFLLKITSANGGVQSPAAAPSGYTNSLAYTLDFSLPVDESATPLTASCVSSTLVAGQSSCSLSPAGSGLNSSGRTAINQTAAMRLSWITPSSPRLIAGGYSDTLTISVAAAP